MKEIYVIIRKSVVNGKIENVMIVSDGYTNRKDAQKKLYRERDIFKDEWDILYGKENFVLNQDENYFSVYRETKYGVSYTEENVEGIHIKEIA